MIAAAAASSSSLASSSSTSANSATTTTSNSISNGSSGEPLEYFHSQLKSIKQNSLNVNNVYHNDFGAYFVKKLIPHVKSFAYTWFHLQAAKRKHFKNEDKRMNYADEQQLKQRLMNESPSVKIKWAVRLLMKLRKDIQKMNQKDLIDVIADASQSTTSDDKSSCKCVISNPDMKGKMRRIDCLRQSDKVWRLDLVMVVLFKGIPLESSDGERLDKLPECAYPQLCINPNHALLNVRDLEIYLANYIKNQSNSQADIKLDCYKNIVSPSVFTSNEFLTLSNITILDGATENDLKSSLNIVTSSSNSHYSDDNDEGENTNTKSRQLVQASDDLEDKGSILKKIVNLQQNNINPNGCNAKTDENLLINPQQQHQQQQQQQQQQQYYLLQNHQATKRPLETNNNSNTINSDNENQNDDDINKSLNSKQQQQQQQQANSTPKKKKTKSNIDSASTSSSSSSSAVSSSTNSKCNTTKTKNLNINEIIEQMKHNNETELTNNTTDFEIRLNDTTTSTSSSSATNKQNGKTTKTRKYSKRDNNNKDETQSNDYLAKSQNDSQSQIIDTAKPITKRRKSVQKQQSDLDSVKSDVSTPRARKSKTTKQIGEGFKIEDDQDANQVNSVPSTTTLAANTNTSSQTNNTTNSLVQTTAAGAAVVSINLSTIEDHSSCSTSSQQDEEIKELLARKGDTLNSFSGIILNSEQVKGKSSLKSISNSGSDLLKKNSDLSTSFANKIITEELKELIQKEKQTTADLYLQLQMLKHKEDQLNSTSSFVNTFSNSISYMHQNSNSSDISISELASINSNNNNNNNTKDNQSSQQQQQQLQQLNQQQFTQRLKSATPVFVDQLLMSPLFNNLIPSCGSSSSSNSSTSTNTMMPQQTNSTSVMTPFSQMAAAVSAVLSNTNQSNSNKSTPSSSPTINIETGILKLNSNQYSFKRTKDNIKNSSKGNNSANNNPSKQPTINSSCINALRFDTNSNGSYDELINLANQVQANEKKSSFNRSSPRTIKIENQATRFINRGLSGSQTPRANDSNETESHAHTSVANTQDGVNESDDSRSLQAIRAQTTPSISSSPPPPPPIGTTVIPGAPSPTKFYPYSANSNANSHIMHRPIPILQKADATMSSLINNLTSSSSLSCDLNKIHLVSKLNVNNINNSSNSNENLNDTTNNNNNNNNNTTSATNNTNSNATDTHTLMNKTPTSDFNELIKINNQQQQIISSLRSNSINNNNNSPLMFSNHLSMSFNSNNNIFSNYPNISPANGMNGAMMGGNGNGSPTSNLFPSITSLFQSPIGTPRVTPTPQQFAAYLFNEDQFHSLIFPQSSLSSSGGLNSDQAFIDAVLSNTNILSSQSTSSSLNMITNFTSNESNSNLSPLPIFNNLLSTSLTNLANSNSNNQPVTSSSINTTTTTNQSCSNANNNNETILNEANQQKQTNLLSAKE